MIAGGALMTAEARTLGRKYSCFKCSCKFYDLGRDVPLCPRCGADQREDPRPDPRDAFLARLRRPPAPGKGERKKAQVVQEEEIAAPIEADLETAEAPDLEDGGELLDDDLGEMEIPEDDGSEAPPMEEEEPADEE